MTPTIPPVADDEAMRIASPNRLKRVRGVRRVEADPWGDGWIARDQAGNELLEPGFRWNTRSGAWHAAFEAEIFSEPRRAALQNREAGDE